MHCVSTSNLQELALLKDVLDTLEQMSTNQEHSNRQYELCRALYRIAKEHLASRPSDSGHFENMDSANWAWLDTNELLEPFMSGRASEWDITNLDI